MTFVWAGLRKYYTIDFSASFFFSDFFMPFVCLIAASDLKLSTYFIFLPVTQGWPRLFQLFSLSNFLALFPFPSVKKIDPFVSLYWSKRTCTVEKFLTSSFFPQIVVFSYCSYFTLSFALFLMASRKDTSNLHHLATHSSVKPFHSSYHWSMLSSLKVVYYFFVLYIAMI